MTPAARLINGQGSSEDSAEYRAAEAPNSQRLFDIAASVEYLKAIGATSASPNFVRGLISSGQVPHLKIGKKFYLSKTAMDAWLANHERRSR